MSIELPFLSGHPSRSWYEKTLKRAQDHLKGKPGKKRVWQPPKAGEFKVKPGRRVIWLSRPSSLSVALVVTATVGVVIGSLSLSVPVVPLVWYTLKPATIDRLGKSIAKPVATQPQAQVKKIDAWQPPFDSTLPEGNWIGTEKIGLKTLIREAAPENIESALKQGVWRVPDFGTPTERKLPIILAAHRYGYLKWTNEFRRQNSFYYLPKLTPGDRVYIVWNKHKYIYEIYAANEGTEITDYTADLILYTCQYLESPRRIFRYARLVRE